MQYLLNFKVHIIVTFKMGNDNAQCSVKAGTNMLEGIRMANMVS